MQKKIPKVTAKRKKPAVKNEIEAKVDTDLIENTDNMAPLEPGQVAELRRSGGRASRRPAPMTAFKLLNGLKTVMDIDDKANELDEIVLRDVVIKINFHANGKYYHLEETTLYQCVKAGGMESFVRDVYGCGSFELVLRGFVTETRKGIIASPRFEVLGQPTERMKMLMEQANRMRVGGLPSGKASYEPQEDAYRSRDEVAELKAQINRMAEDNRLEQLTRRLDDNRKSDSDAINKRLDDMQTPKSNSVTELVTAVIGILPTLLKREENPVMMELLRKRMSGSETLENARSMLEMMRELAPTLGGSGVTVGNEPNLIEQIISGVAPLLNRNKGEIIQESQPASVPTDNPFPQTVAHYENLQALARTQVAPVEFVKALISAYGIAKQEDAIASLFPELARSDDLSKSMRVFLQRFDMTPDYLESVINQLDTYQGKLTNE
ncbi:hypothetical protein IH992_04115 [Candidatus Poribacteria bacterium]|nr:hypothetical protein [Candidatus Poribacteria bacterium]